MKHKHHIIPKHAGGGDEHENITELTVEEHAEAHKKLYDAHGRWEDYLAWQGLSGMMFKEQIIHTLLSEAGKKGGKKRSESLSKEKLSEVGKKGAEANWHQNENKMRKVLLKNSHKSKKLKEETGRGIGGMPTDTWMWITDGRNNTKILKTGVIPENWQYGRTKTWKTAVSKLQKPIVVCPTCGRIGGKPVMTRYHFDNCKGKEYWEDKTRG
jgi:general stress protein YciG